MYTYIYRDVCIYMCVYIYIYTNIHTHTHVSYKAHGAGLGQLQQDLLDGVPERREEGRVLNMYAYICTYVYICIYIYIYVCAYAYTCVRMYAYICIYIYIYREREKNMCATRSMH